MPASHREAPVTRYLDDDDRKAGGSGDGGAQGCDHDGWFWIQKRFLMVFGFDDDIQASCISSTHLPVQPSGFHQRMIILSSIFKFPIQITLATRAPAYKPGEGGRLAKLYSTGRPYYGPKKKVRTYYANWAPRGSNKKTGKMWEGVRWVFYCFSWPSTLGRLVLLPSSPQPPPSSLSWSPFSDCQPRDCTNPAATSVDSRTWGNFAKASIGWEFRDNRGFFQMIRMMIMKDQKELGALCQHQPAFINLNYALFRRAFDPASTWGTPWHSSHWGASSHSCSPVQVQ